MFKKFKTHIISITLSLFMVAGSFRALFGLDQKIYFVLIGVLFLICFIGILHIAYLPKGLGIYIILGSIFILWLITSSMWTISHIQWKEDFILLFGLFSILLLVSYNLNYHTVELFKKYMILFCGVIALLVIYYSGGIFNIKGYGTLVNEFYLNAGNAIATGFIISVVQFYLSNSKRLFWLISLIFFMGALGISLSRGALVFSLLVVLFLIFFTIKINLNDTKIKKKYFLRLIFVVPIFCGLILISLNVERTKFRLSRMISIENELISGGRGILWKNAWEGIADLPFFGYGLGGNGLVVGSDDSYPHNMLLQIWLDGGIVALILGILFLSFPIYTYFKNIKNIKYESNGIMLFLLYLFYCLHYSKSSNFYTARILVILGVLLVFWVSFKKSIKHARIMKG